MWMLNVSNVATCSLRANALRNIGLSVSCEFRYITDSLIASYTSSDIYISNEIIGIIYISKEILL